MSPMWFERWWASRGHSSGHTRFAGGMGDGIKYPSITITGQIAGSVAVAFSAAAQERPFSKLSTSRHKYSDVTTLT